MNPILAIMRRQSLRLRITVAFATLGIVLATVLATTTFVAVRSFLETQRVRSATRSTVLNVMLFARDFFRQPDADPEEFVATLQARGGFDALMIVPGDWFSTSLSITPDAAPDALRALVRDEEVAYQFVTLNDERRVAFGTPLPPAGTDLYLFYSMEDIDRTLSIVLRVLLVSGLVVIAISVIAAQRVTRALLRPLAEVSAAAQQVAEGLLETRVATVSGDEVGSLAASFNEMAGALQEMIERERRFVANVSHELRTPLATLRTASELLVGHREELTPVTREAADLITEDVTNLQRLVEELMEVSAVDAGKASIRWELVDLRAMAEAVIDKMHRTVDVEGGPAITMADKARVERIVANLLDNAFEHGGGADVRVRVGTDVDDAWLRVSDAGPGIAPEDLPRLFDRFFKADTSRARDRGGIGLGLAIASENARLLGGTVDVDGAPGAGATFTLRLPLRDAAPGEP